MSPAALPGPILLLLLSLVAQSPPVPRFEPVAADEFPIAIPGSREGTVGYLVVWENRETRTSTIRLPVAIVRAATPSGREPVLFLAGGPGSGDLSPAAYPGAYPWTSDRDFIVFGQRGTRHAQPALECPEIEAAFEAPPTTDGAAARGGTMATAARSCRDRLEGLGIDLSAYHTDAIAEDIDELGSVLGQPRLILFALSYGTRVALDVARDIPDRIEAMVLDSPLPPDARYDDESAVNFRNALAAVAVRCSTMPECDSAYPRLMDRFFARLDSAEGAPIEVRLPGSAGVVELDGARLAALVGMGSPAGVRAAPRTMDAVASGDPDRIRPLISTTGSGSGFAWGMRASVWCSEAWPFSERSRTSGPGPTLGGYESAAIPPSICEEWGVPARPDGFVRPVRSAVPTLLLAGEFDPSTPPEWGWRALRWLENGRLVVIRGATHTPSVQWDGDGCAMTVVAGFVADPQGWLAADELPECVAEAPEPAFLLPARAPNDTSPRAPASRGQASPFGPSTGGVR